MPYAETGSCSPEITVSHEEVEFSVLTNSLLYHNADSYVLVAATHNTGHNKTCKYVHDSQFQGSYRRNLKKAYEKTSAVSNCEHCSVALPHSNGLFGNEAISMTVASMVYR